MCNSDGTSLTLQSAGNQELLDRAKVHADAINFVHLSAPSPMGSSSGSGKVFSQFPQRKTSTGKKSLKIRRAPSKSRTGLSPGYTTDRPAENWLVLSEWERRAAEIISECSRLGLWEEARSVYDLVVANGTGSLGSGARGSLAQFQAEALSLLDKTMSAEAC